MENIYESVTHQIIDELKAIVGKNNVLSEKNEMVGYSTDEMPIPKPHAPEVVVKPPEIDSICRLLEYANKKRIPVTPRGGGTGLSGGCIPVHGGIVLSLDRLNRILEVDKENFVAIVESGVALSDLCNQVEQQGLYYPLYPGEMSATIGGNIATNAGGMNAVKYGVTRQNVLGLEAVLPNGQIIRTGGKFVKCSSGYDLTQLIIGSEGTLAVVTKIILKLTTKQSTRELLFAPFTSLEDALNAVPEILRLKITPTGIEFIEKSIVDIIENYLKIDIPYHQYNAFLMIIVEGQSENEIYNYFSEVEEICKRHGAITAVVPSSQRAKRKLLKARENFYHALKKYAPMEVIDIVVPRNEIANLAKKAKIISKKYKIPIIVYGHAGDGNVHLHPLCSNMDREEWNGKLPHLMTDLYRAGVSLGGAISGEHGIGFDKKPYFCQETDNSLLTIMKEIKKAFDPNNILNPGKIFEL